jgi:predicted amidophosphoribosyltransferase
LAQTPEGPSPVRFRDVPRDPRKNLILGDRCAICPRCGHARRYLRGVTSPADERCPDCGERMLTECASCGATIESAMQVRCRVCEAPLRGDELFGTVIRRKAEPRTAPAAPET